MASSPSSPPFQPPAGANPLLATGSKNVPVRDLTWLMVSIFIGIFTLVLSCLCCRMRLKRLKEEREQEKEEQRSESIVHTCTCEKKVIRRVLTPEVTVELEDSTSWSGLRVSAVSDPVGRSVVAHDRPESYTLPSQYIPNAGERSRKVRRNKAVNTAGVDELSHGIANAAAAGVPDAELKESKRQLANAMQDLPNAEEFAARHLQRMTEAKQAWAKKQRKVETQNQIAIMRARVEEIQTRPPSPTRKPSPNIPPTTTRPREAPQSEANSKALAAVYLEATATHERTLMSVCSSNPFFDPPQGERSKRRVSFDKGRAAKDNDSGQAATVASTVASKPSAGQVSDDEHRRLTLRQELTARAAQHARAELMSVAQEIEAREDALLDSAALPSPSSSVSGRGCHASQRLHSPRSEPTLPTRCLNNPQQIEEDEEDVRTRV